MSDQHHPRRVHDAYHEMRLDSWALSLGALSVIAWAICIGAVILHIAGASSLVADVVALCFSTVVGLAWFVIVFVAEW